MKNMSRALAIGACATLSAALLAACGSDAPASTVAADCEPIAEVETVKDGVLSAAIAEFPPYIGSKDGQPTGVDGELLKKIAGDLCLELDAQVNSFPAITAALDAGKVDLSAGSWTISAERQQKYEVSEPVYYSLAGLVSADGWSTIEELEGKSVGTTTGYVWVGDLQSALGSGNVKLYQSEQAVYDDIKAGRIDAGLFTPGAVAQYMKDDGNPADLTLKTLEPTPLIEMTVNEPTTGVLIRKGATDLLAAVNTTVADFNSSGELLAALKKAGMGEESVPQ
jgi:polar amino acid transport system substrate-binding protein